MVKLKAALSTLFCVSSLCIAPHLNAAVPDLGDPSCGSILLVSSWTRDNVKIYDGCSGEFVRDLDSQGLINGPLTILEAPDGDILVVSEENHRIIKWDRETLSQGQVVLGDDPTTAEVENNFIVNPVSAVIDENGTMYAASFTQNSVVKIDTETWTITDEMLPANSGHINGIDAGMALGDDNHLYLPGFYSHNIIKLNLNTKAVTSVVAAQTAGLDNPRTIVFRGDEMVVTAEGTGAVMVFNRNTGAYIRTIVELSGPTGLRDDGDEHFIVNNSRAVYRGSYDGNSFETIVQIGAGSLSGGTFVHRLFKTGLDDDNDGLTNEEETEVYGTDPQDADSDDDNLTDGEEVKTHGTSPLLADTDTDGMPDDYEVSYELKATIDDADEDPDSDNLINLDEYLAGTNPKNDDTDGDGEKDGDDENPLVPNTAPELSGTPLTSVEQGQVYSFVPELSYVGDLATVSLSITNKPSWASFDVATGALTGTPDNSAVGVTSDIVISATNGFHVVSLAAFALEVLNVNDAPRLIGSIGDQNFTVEQNVSLNLATFFEDVDIGDSLTFLGEGMPPGLSVSETGVLSGAPTAAGSTTANLTATDLAGASISSTFNITVQEKSTSSGGGSVSWFIMLLAVIRARHFKTVFKKVDVKN